MSYRQQPAQQYGAPPSQYGGQEPSGYESSYGNTDHYAQRQPEDQREQNQHDLGAVGDEQDPHGHQMHDQDHPHDANNGGNHAILGQKAGSQAGGAKRRHPLEHLHEDKNHNNMMGVMHKMSNEPITNAHLFSFIHLVMLFCSYVMKHLGATASGEEEEEAHGVANGDVEE